MAQTKNDDLFEGTKMTFGEHLEELRVCLFRAVFGLVLGFLIGLGVAKYVVRLVQTPLKEALKGHYVEKTVDRLEMEFENIPQAELLNRFDENGNGKLDEAENKAAAVEREQLIEFVNKYHLMYEIAYVERGLVNSALEEAETAKEPDEKAPTKSDDVDNQVILKESLPFPDASQMVPVRIWRPFLAKITSLNAQEAFMIWLKAAFVTGLIISSPYMFFQIWLFVSAGLYPHERKYVYLYLPISAVLFWSGVALAFFGVFRFVLTFLLQFNASMDIDAEPRISEWISLVLMLPVGFGIAFQLPLVMLFMNRLGIFTVDSYVSKWRIAVLIISFLSMILTPADPISMIMMAVPLTALYFLGIGFCRWMPRGRNPFDEAYEP